MTIQGMHYDFKSKLNKVDSATFRNMKIPEIDWKLNEALNLYILLIAVPRLRNQFGVETIQRTIDDLYPLIVNAESLSEVTPSPSGRTVYSLPSDYFHYLSLDIEADKATCTGRKMNVNVIRHGSEDESLEFYKSSFEWSEINIRFYEEGITAFTPDFTISSAKMDYLKKHPFIHNADNFLTGGYKLPDGVISITGTQDCILPDKTHYEIVDLAVLITTGDLVIPTSYQLKMNKLKIQQLTN